jgi:hypothetical protein
LQFVELSNTFEGMLRQRHTFELERLHAAYVLTKTQSLHSRILTKLAKESKSNNSNSNNNESNNDNNGRIAAQLRREVLQMLNDIPPLIDSIAKSRTHSALLEHYNVRIEWLHKLCATADTLVGTIRLQHSRQRFVFDVVHKLLSHARHSAILLASIAEDMRGALESHKQRRKDNNNNNNNNNNIDNEDNNSNNNQANSSTMYALELRRAVALVAGSEISLDELEKTVQQTQQEHTMKTARTKDAIRKLEDNANVLRAFLFGATTTTTTSSESSTSSPIQWREKQLAEDFDRARQLLQQSGESLSNLEKSRARVEEEWKRRPADVVNLERTMMELFWEDPVTTTRLNARLAALATGKKL